MHNPSAAFSWNWFENVIKNVVKIVNETASPPLESRLFKILCESGFVAWTLCPYRIKMAVKTASSIASYWAQTRNKTIFKRKEVSIGSIFLDEMLMSKRAYLVDMFCHLNKFKTSLQWFCTNIFVLRHRCRSRKIFQGAKNFCLNFPKLARKVFCYFCLQIFS